MSHGAMREYKWDWGQSTGNWIGLASRSLQLLSVRHREGSLKNMATAHSFLLVCLISDSVVYVNERFYIEPTAVIEYFPVFSV